MVVRDEEEQARYVLELLDIFDEEGVDAAFAYTFARGDLPTSSDPERDFDLASPGIVKVLEPGQTGTAYPGLPWEPKAAFRSLSEYGRARVARTGQANAKVKGDRRSAEHLPEASVRSASSREGG